jgi:serine/threonine protein kinase
MPFLKEPHAEPIPGYRLLEPLGRGGYGEVWKCEAPGGLFKAIKFVPGLRDELDTSSGAAAEELRSVERIKAIRHPFLLSMERVESINGELVIVMELADKSLHDLLHERLAEGRPGIERHELIGYLREAADVLDLMNLRHGLQHLDIKPANLFLVSDHVKVADFGLVQSLSERTGQTPASPLGAVTPRYAAPELFRGKISATSDQYSLALVYQELLTSTLPFAGKNFRQLMIQQTTAEPDLRDLPKADRPIVARALAKDPGERFASCREFIQALADATAPRHDTTREVELGGTQVVPPEQAQSLPDFHFVGSLGRFPAGEAWEARGPDGEPWRVNFLYGVAGRSPRQDEEAVARLQAIRHNALPARRIELGSRGCIVVANHLIEMNLRARFQECRARGGAGVTRRELLDWLEPVAVALDHLFGQHGLPHLGINPRNLLLDGDQLRLGDFGLLPVLYHPAGQLATQVQARYAAPEVLAGQTGRAGDVYSLAVIYQEMLTGTHPHRGRPASRGVAPQLEALPVADRAAVARALDLDPARRFASCGEFLDAVRGATREARATLENFQLPQPGSLSEMPVEPLARLAQLIAEAAAEAVASPPVWLSGADGPVLQARFAASMPPSGGLAKFEGFRKQWSAQLLRGDDGSAIFQVGQTGNFWQRWRGVRANLLVEITWSRPRPPEIPLPEVIIHVRPVARDARAGEALVRELGPPLVDSLRKHLVGHHERRSRERVVWARPVRATFLSADGRPSEPIECLGKDLSLTGMGLYLPCALAGADVRLDLTPDHADNPVTVTGQFLRVQRCGDGWYEAGVLFQ